MRPFNVDVVVVGSGASGLTAALAAADLGASVLILEKSDRFGGTSAISGGSMWIPNNRWMKAGGIADSRDDALRYLRAVTMGRGSGSLLESFVDASLALVEFLGDTTDIEFTPNLHHPDYQPELPGGRQGGRTLQVGLFDTNRLGELRPRLRIGHTSLPLRKEEIDDWGLETPQRWDWALLAERTQAGIVGLGAALVGDLLVAALARGAQLECDAAVVGLRRDPQRPGVRGVTYQQDGELHEVEANVGVVLASGGFEWSHDLVQGFLGLPGLAAGSPPTNVGDGLRMSMEVGAALNNMTEAWWGVMLSIPGDTYDGEPLHRPTSGLRALPGGILVNQAGHRFANEAMNYNDLAKAMMAFDPVGYGYPNSPCYLVFDERFRRSYAVGTVTPETKTPPWMHTAPTLRELGPVIGVDAETLSATVAEFNQEAVNGLDPRYRRGESAYDRYRGDPSIAPHRNVRPLEGGPFYAVRMDLGCLGTKGGPLTTANAQVVDVHGDPIPGLYACGNVASSPFALGYPGAGATLASGMTFARLAAIAMCRPAVGAGT